MEAGGQPDGSASGVSKEENDSIREARKARHEPAVQASLHVEHLTRLRDLCSKLRAAENLAEVANRLGELINALRDYHVLDKVRDVVEGEHFLPPTRTCFEILERGPGVEAAESFLERWARSEHAREVLDDICIRLVTRIRQMANFDEAILWWTRQYLDEIVRADPPDWLEDASDYRLIDPRGVSPEYHKQYLSRVVLASPSTSERSDDASSGSAEPTLAFMLDIDRDGHAITITPPGGASPVRLVFRHGDRRDVVNLNSVVGRVVVAAASAGHRRPQRGRDVNLSRARQAVLAATGQRLRFVECTDGLVRFDQRVVVSKRLKRATQAPT